jgi:hypothetical protein
MFNPTYLYDLSCRLHLLARDCLDPQAATELRKTADEVRAKMDDAENLSAYLWAVPDCNHPPC